ncbi:bifunctional MaoC family dehydratase N-terminal/OB-fold nucleic acid binding domain-containing protein [Rhodococcus oxybenzonivorans]|uniref:bifunctional MaoC family dehydratase N-terminal/OB-fold nucleic acid binding domain-containing protein n=1 Tax=Rhodococcus oxybenzonivorans TaxID=1990687 RepID=UPI002954BE71|nr:bifunctional MaoC family dehydratase N-terminal/OB-fold nucleic acid binding domain-containing protein [Rhodococcus oxybenzonivorans]MDV7356551.1 bifunctional MaoC family dehydratase N-terminal/OB-fold nucleic acid binding domain-containing protein [Rhodococcus oxybenzonivorans]
MSAEQILAAAEKVRSAGPSAPRPGRDPINLPMIRNWVEAIGDRNPIYVDEDAARAAGHDGIVAPPAMVQVWTMQGLHAERQPDDPLGRMTTILDEAGYTSVVATNCDQTYRRYLRLGEKVTISTTLEDVVGPKKTGLGEGWFFTTRSRWTVANDEGADEVVAEMLFRILKFAPKPAEPVGPSANGQGASFDDLDPSKMMRPSASQDTQFFWDGVAAHELRIQKRADGSLQHPPVPALWKDKAESTDYLVASGRGTVFSFVVHHAPKVPGRSLPFVVALVELEEGVRMLGELRGVEPSAVGVGMPVEAIYLDFPGDDDTGGAPWTLYAWQPATKEH